MRVMAPAMQDCREFETIQDTEARTAPGRVSASGLGHDEDKDDEAGGGGS